MDHLAHKDLIKGDNNVWYEYNCSDDVLVFVHGFFSESSGCWLYEDKKDPSKNLFWPDLIRTDTRLGNPSLFLGGYHTAVDSGTYGFEKCADELFRAMNRLDENGHQPVLSKGGIIFVCHSMGGIIARYALERNKEAFATKRVGFVLIASPSYGSVHADRLALLAELYNQQQGLKMKWGDALLKDLDSRFKDLVNDKKIAHLIGVEACENNFILHRKFIPNRNIVVTEESAGRYFGAPKILRGTDHFSAVKPDGLRHPAHELLVDFWYRYDSQTADQAALNSFATHPPTGGETSGGADRKAEGQTGSREDTNVTPRSIIQIRPSNGVGLIGMEDRQMADLQFDVEPIEVFVSYSHADERLQKCLIKHLALLKNEGFVRDWHDRQIGVGTEWEDQIDEHLDSARIILLLVSADFLASSYCYGIEMKRAMERHERKHALVIPIILRECDWHTASFGKLQALPKDARPITNWGKRDSAFTDVAKGIRTAVRSLLSNPL